MKYPHLENYTEGQLRAISRSSDAPADMREEAAAWLRGLEKGKAAKAERAAQSVALASPPKPKARHPEQDLHRAIWQLYKLRYETRFIMFHAASGEKRTARTAAILKMMGVVAGIPDFIGLLPGGRFFGLEVKAEKGRLSPAQIEMRDRILAAGGIWGEVRSLEDFQRWAVAA